MWYVGPQKSAAKNHGTNLEAHRLTNEDLYAMCGCLPASVQVINARWSLFGHVLRVNEDVPARQAMALYFEGLGKDIKGRQGNFCSIASVLSDDL